MPQQEIPCSDCGPMKEEIEEAGDQVVVSCDPIPSKPGWCLIVWKRKP